jgi:hypothetical protein
VDARSGWQDACLQQNCDAAVSSAKHGAVRFFYRSLCESGLPKIHIKFEMAYERFHID